MQLENIESDGVKRSKVTLAVSQEDAEKLMAAFKEGKLKELGILDLEVRPPELADDSKSQGEWSKRSKTTGQDRSIP